MENVETEVAESKPNNYFVDKKRFHVLMLARHETLRDNPEESLRVSEELGSILLKVSSNLSFRYNFINYPFREEMVGDGVENCLKYIDNYDPINYKNPFAYFTQCCWYAFVRRILREKKQFEGKIDLYERQCLIHGITDSHGFENAVTDDYMREELPTDLNATTLETPTV